MNRRRGLVLTQPRRAGELHAIKLTRVFNGTVRQASASSLQTSVHRLDMSDEKHSKFQSTGHTLATRLKPTHPFSQSCCRHMCRGGSFCSTVETQAATFQENRLTIKPAHVAEATGGSCVCNVQDFSGLCFESRSFRMHPATSASLRVSRKLQKAAL